MYVYLYILRMKPVKSVDFFNQFFKAIFSQIFHRFQISRLRKIWKTVMLPCKELCPVLSNLRRQPWTGPLPFNSTSLSSNLLLMIHHNNAITY